MAWLPSLVFAFSAAWVLYVIFGYPLLLAVLARRPGPPVHKRFEPKSVSVILCVYNGEAWMRAKLQSILRLSYPRERIEILVVSDGSTDRTEEIAREFAAGGVQVIRVPHGGKAAALNAGIARATGDILFFTDVRQPLDPGCLKSLVATLGDPAVGAACGHICFAGDAAGAHLGLYWRYEKWIRQNHTRLDSILAGTGCIQAMRRELAVPVPPDTLLDDSYLPLSAFCRGYRFVLDPGAIAWEYPNSLESEFRRKVRTLAGVYQLVGYFPALVRPGRRMALHFISYKLGRVLLPFALLLMFAASFGLPGMLARLALAAQALVYLLALVQPWVPGKGWLPQTAAVCRTFVILMCAALCAVAVFFVPARRLWVSAR